MLRRTNPWPSFVELFSALLTATFAGFIVITVAYQQEVAEYKKRELEIKKSRVEADKIIDKVKNSLVADASMQKYVRPCGDDTCIDLYIHFEKNGDVIQHPEELKALSSTCTVLKNSLDTLSQTQKKDIEVIIEGHTDNTQVSGSDDSRVIYLFNWNLSGKRATSVLYEFQKCGLRAPSYQILAIGYADSDPICKEENDECQAKNRRTTLRLRADTKRIEERLKNMSNIH